MGNDLVVRNEMDVMKLGEVLAASGYFSDAKQAGQAVVKVLAGQELGIGPIASMTGINIIKGQVSPGASVIAAVVKRSSKYNYTIRKLLPDECIIEYFENGVSIGLSTFTADDAKRAGTTNMGKYPRNMLFARAMSNGAKWYTPDLFGGPIYEPGELGAIVDYETGAVIDQNINGAEIETLDGDGPKWENATEDPKALLVIDPDTATVIEVQPEEKPAPARQGVRPLDPDTLRDYLQQKIDQSGLAQPGQSATNSQRGLVAGKLEECFAPEIDAGAKRKSVLFWLMRSETTKDLSMAQASALLDWLLDKNASPGTYDLHKHAPEEARRVLKIMDDQEEYTEHYEE